MSELIEKNVNGDFTGVKAPAEGHIALITDYSSLNEHLTRAGDKYLQRKREYLNSWVDDPDFLLKHKRWQRASREYIRWAGTLFNANQYNNKDREYAQEIMDKVTKDSSMRHNNILQYTQLKIDQNPGDNKTIDEMDDLEFNSAAFVRCASMTQKRFHDLFEKGENYVSPVMKNERAGAARAAEMREKVLPKDRIYQPGWIIPPYPVPKKQRVPSYPDPYEVYKSQPVEAYEYDYEVDEPVLKEGYVSPDGLVDRNSVVYDRKNGKCTMKYRGGVPVTWDWWKPKDIRDLPPEGSWTEEYLQRHYRQVRMDDEFSILKHKWYEDETQDYNRIPAGIDQENTEK